MINEPKNYFDNQVGFLLCFFLSLLLKDFNLKHLQERFLHSQNNTNYRKEELTFISHESAVEMYINSISIGCFYTFPHLFWPLFENQVLFEFICSIMLLFSLYLILTSLEE